MVRGFDLLQTARKRTSDVQTGALNSESKENQLAELGDVLYTAVMAAYLSPKGAHKKRGIVKV